MVAANWPAVRSWNFSAQIEIVVSLDARDLDAVTRLLVEAGYLPAVPFCVDVGDIITRDTDRLLQRFQRGVTDA